MSWFNASIKLATSPTYENPCAHLTAVAGVVDDVLGWYPAGLSVDGDSPPAVGGEVCRGDAVAVGESLQDAAAAVGLGAQDGVLLGPVGVARIDADVVRIGRISAVNTFCHILAYGR